MKGDQMDSVKRYEPCFHRSADEGIKEVRNGNLVLYTDYAALKARVAELEGANRALGKLATEQEKYANENALLWQEVVTERDSLRAQLEAAKVCACPRCFTQMQVDPSAKLQALTAQPDGVRAILEKLSCLGNGARPGNSEGNVLAQDALRLLDKQALAAPAPAKVCDGYHHPQAPCPDCSKENRK